MHITKPYYPHIIVSSYTTEWVYLHAIKQSVLKKTPTPDREYKNIHALLAYGWFHYIRYDYDSSYIIKTDSGRIVTPSDIPAEYFPKPKPPRRIGGRKPSTGHYYRRPKTHCEAKAYYNPDIEEYGVKVRGTRKAKHLPTVYWDRVTPYGQKNWKNYRKTQWKAK